MNSAFAQRVLQPIDPATVWPNTTSPTAHSGNKPLPKDDAEMVLGYEPTNRHERRKAKKLLRERHAKTLRARRPRATHMD